MKRILLIAVVLLSTFTFAYCQENTQKADVFVTIENIKEVKGNIMLALYDSEASYMKDMYRSEILPVKTSGEAVYCFKDLPEGKYALCIFHDENKNEELDSNLVGIPKESFGFSNNAMGSFGPAPFSEASFEVKGERTDISIRLRTLLTK